MGEDFDARLPSWGLNQSKTEKQSQADAQSAWAGTLEEEVEAIQPAQAAPPQSWRAGGEHSNRRRQTDLNQWVGVSSRPHHDRDRLSCVRYSFINDDRLHGAV